MKNEFKLIFDTNKIFYIRAKSRGKAIEKYCRETGACKEWVKVHCTVKNLGRIKT